MTVIRLIYQMIKEEERKQTAYRHRDCAEISTSRAVRLMYFCRINELHKRGNN